MNNNIITNILDSKIKITDLKVKELEKLCKIFPYCEVTKVIDLNFRKNNNDLLFEKKLTEAIIHVSDRSFLFSLLHKEKNKKIKNKEEKRKSVVNKKLSFNEWLFGEKERKIFGEKERKKENLNFYNNLANNDGSDDLMTETLAKLYIEQKHFEQAIRAYEILCLKYPKKSSFFVREIEKIKKLILINDE